MFTYKQSTGELSQDGQTLTTAYSGHGAGVDNPAMEYVPDVGPIPVGVYTIGPEFTHPQAGPICMRLTPNAGTDTHGRDGFMMHGDNQLGNHSASEGCIIVARPVRIMVSETVAQGSDQLTVIA